MRVTGHSRREAPPGTLKVPTALLAWIRARLEMAWAVTGRMPGWLVEVIADPLTYDAAAANRKDLCAG